MKKVYVLGDTGYICASAYPTDRTGGIILSGGPFACACVCVCLRARWMRSSTGLLSSSSILDVLAVSGDC